MPIFHVTLTRETVDEIEVLIEAPDLTSFNQLTDDDVYEAVNEYKELDDWTIIENGIDVLIREIETRKKPLLVFNERAAENETPLKKYVPPQVDPRQMALPGTEVKHG